MCHVSLRFAVTRINILFLGDGERETCARATRTAAADDRREPRDPQTTTRRPRSRTTRDAHARARPPPADAAHARRERGRERPRPTATADCARTDDVDLEAHVWLACHTTSARDPGRGRARGCAARGGRRARGRATRARAVPAPASGHARRGRRRRRAVGPARARPPIARRRGRHARSERTAGATGEGRSVTDAWFASAIRRRGLRATGETLASWFGASRRQPEATSNSSAAVRNARTRRCVRGRSRGAC